MKLWVGKLSTVASSRSVLVITLVTSLVIVILLGLWLFPTPNPGPSIEPSPSSTTNSHGEGCDQYEEFEDGTAVCGIFEEWLPISPSPVIPSAK